MSRRPFGVFYEASRRSRAARCSTADGLPKRNDIHYVCVGRDPRDAVISMMHHRNNLDRVRLSELSGVPISESADLSVLQQFDQFIDGGKEPGWNLAFVAHHYATFWAERANPRVGLFHFADYLANLPEELKRLAALLEITLSASRALELAKFAGINAARNRAEQVAPDAHRRIWKDPSRFFRQGSQGEGAELMTPEQLHRYEGRVKSLVPVDLAQWMHTGAAIRPSPSGVVER